MFVIVQLIFLVMLLGVAWVWLKQFVWMMSLGDDSFAGRYDKLIWGLAFVSFSQSRHLLSSCGRGQLWSCGKGGHIDSAFRRSLFIIYHLPFIICYLIRNSPNDDEENRPCTTLKIANDK